MSQTQLGCEPSLFKDDKLEELGNFVKEKINNYLPESEKNRGLKAIKTVHIGDFEPPSNLEYPLIKIFRLSTNFKRRSSLRFSYVSIVYLVQSPVLKTLPGLLNWYSYYINRVLQEWEFKESKINPYNADDFLQDDSITYGSYQIFGKSEIFTGVRVNLRIIES